MIMGNFLQKMKKFIDKILNIIFPEDYKCVLCGMDLSDKNSVFCKECLESDIFNEGNRCVKCDAMIKKSNIVCDHCKNQKRYFERCVCPLNYNQIVKSTILKLKDDDALYYVAPFAKLIVQRLKEENIDFDIIVPVPSHPKTVKRRGYNPALLLANEIGKLLDKQVVEALTKNVITKKQKRLNFEERQINLHDSMTLIDKTAIKDKVVLIVDDIITTCATINTCSSLLKGAKKIYATAIARTNLD